ncbi:liprin-beta-1 isoform X3 [Schistocerca nitens]|uniref:liprin-beta-1 isoform X3 n=1 Tax=Schistocerca nitens TaxID=7011 RepID=UPI00211962AB|nr:liprin-beta-1 isoform X3 [Schistocerca nitens]
MSEGTVRAHSTAPAMSLNRARRHTDVHRRSCEAKHDRDHDRDRDGPDDDDDSLTTSSDDEGGDHRKAEGDWQRRSMGPGATAGGDDSSPDDESTLKCGAGQSHSDSSHSSSSSELSSSCSSDEDKQKQSHQDQNTKGCRENFHWIKNSSIPVTRETEDSCLLQSKEAENEENHSFSYIQIEPCRGIKNEESDFRSLESPVPRGKDIYSTQDFGSVNGPTHKPPLRGSAQKLPPPSASPSDKGGSLDRRRKRCDRSTRDSKCRSSAALRYRSPSPQQRLPACHGSVHHGSWCDLSSSHCHLHNSHGCSCAHGMPTPQICPCRSFCACHLCSGSQPDLYGAVHGCWHGSRSTLTSKPPGEGEERIRKLEADKESLQLQVSVLTEQIEAQGDKIADLEKTLDEKRKQLDNSENLLQREMLTRSSLETQKLELMSTISDLKLQMAALERENIDLRERLSEERRRNKPPLAPRAAAHATSTPIGSPAANMQQILVGASPSPSPVSSMSDGSPRRIGSQSNSGEDYKDIPPPRTPPANYRRKVDHYGSLPRQRSLGATIGSSGGTSGSATAPVPLSLSSVTMDGVAARKGVAFADAERVVIEDSHVEEEEEEEDVGSSLSPQQSPLQATRNKGIKKIFGRMKRSGSGNLEDLPIPSLMTDGEFRRGGVRATAGPRLGWNSQPPPPPLPDGPFAQWDSDSVARWLTEMGLECYAIEAKRWVKSGAQLLAASQQEIEKELGIKNPLHRKKLLLALASVSESPAARADPLLAAAGHLDSAWVLRWLDDAGLPQHKEVFLAARVDGRVLHRLAEQDLALLHVTSSLHVASLRRGIQVLRDHNFEPDCLKRRSLPDESSQPTPQEVALWTNHRVMEWLRAVDLAEYAPNLRGSGVHGGLMVHEPRFTAELLASLLSIPPSKTLLRRHLNTHFKELLGRDCIQEKREAEATLGYVPLSATTKVKLAKKSQFTLKRKKSKSELDFGDLVCPMDSAKQGEASHGDGAMKMNAQQKAGVVSQVTDAQGTVLTQPLRDSPQGDRTSNV